MGLYWKSLRKPTGEPHHFSSCEHFPGKRDFKDLSVRNHLHRLTLSASSAFVVTNETGYLGPIS